jgi:hypothetical protein
LDSGLEECDHDLVLIDVPSEVVVDVLVLLELFLHIRSHLLSYLFVVRGCLGLVSLVSLLQLLGEVFVRLDPFLSLFLHLLKEENSLALRHVKLLFRVERRLFRSEIELALYVSNQSVVT